MGLGVGVKPFTILRSILLIAFGVGLAVPVTAQTDASISAGNGTMYLGAFPNRIFVIDEATEQVVDEIEVSVGTPRSLALSEDRSRFYMLDSTFEKFEIIDVARRETIDTFTLSEGNRKVRIRSFRVHPDGSYVLLVVDPAVKLIDRFEVEPRKLVQYDLQTHEVSREIPWPTGARRAPPRSMLFSPDGRLLYYFDQGDVLILETDTFTEVDRWALSEPIEDGLARINFNFSRDLINEEPGFFTGIFRIHDEIQDRDLMGIARIDLPNRDLDFYTLGPSESESFALAPGRKRAYGFSSEIGRYEFWTFDLENRRLASRERFAGRPRMALRVSTNGKVLYIYQAGRTIDLYDAESYTHLRTLALDGDMTTELIILPPDE